MLKAGEHFEGRGEPVPATVEAGMLLPVQGVQPEGFQVLVVQGQAEKRSERVLDRRGSLRDRMNRGCGCPGTGNGDRGVLISGCYRACCAPFARPKIST